jgi:hypothetical protein
MRIRSLAGIAVGLAGAATAITLALTTATSTWTTVVNDQFDTAGLPAHWALYNSFWSNHKTTNCAAPSQVSVPGDGYLHILMQWKSSTCAGTAFTGWYSEGLRLNNSYVPSSNAARVTIRWRVVSNGVISHRVIPMRWPDSCSTSPMHACGEEDDCESTGTTHCTTFLHYGAASGTDRQISHAYTVDLTHWHTWTFEQNTSQEMRTWLDGTLVWTCTARTSPACNSTTIPTFNKHVVLDQECASAGQPCPARSSGTEDIEIDWITVENAS